MKDVLVIGGGVAGLVAARECAHLGLSVVVLEAAGTPGGAVAGHEVAGLPLDAGAESFAVRGNTVADFIADPGRGLAAPAGAPARRRTRVGAAAQGRRARHPGVTAGRGRAPRHRLVRRP